MRRPVTAVDYLPVSWQDNCHCPPPSRHLYPVNRPCVPKSLYRQQRSSCVIKKLWPIAPPPPSIIQLHSSLCTRGCGGEDHQPVSSQDDGVLTPLRLSSAIPGHPTLCSHALSAVRTINLCHSNTLATNSLPSIPDPPSLCTLGLVSGDYPPVSSRTMAYPPLTICYTRTPVPVGGHNSSVSFPDNGHYLSQWRYISIKVNLHSCSSFPYNLEHVLCCRLKGLVLL